ncbi:MAG: 8-amino-7-oxononanoate synthase [Planctomycetota bacterium]
MAHRPDTRCADTKPADLIQQLKAHANERRTHAAQRSLTPADSVGKFITRTVDGQPRRLLNLAGNDYLALATHPRLRDAANAANHHYGTGSAASRLVTGTLPPHASLEPRFAAFKHAEAALLFPTGTMANLGVLTALARPGDLICQDKLNHACLIDGAKFSGATVRTFPHQNYDKLERLLHQATPPSKRRVFVTTDAVFSMDGTVADLPRLLELCNAHNATLIVDEAHGTGILGKHGTGLAEHQGVASQIPITVSTASKALGCVGGLVTAAAPVIDELVNHARTFIYTTAPPASVPASIDAALDVIRDEPQRRQRLADIIQHVRAGLRDAGWNVTDDPTPIVPLTLGQNEAALAFADQLQQAGFLAVAIRPPTVAPGTARVRLSLRCDLTDDECDALVRAAACAI